MATADALIRFLHGQPVVVLFLLLGCGYLLGRIKVAGFAFGPIAGTLLIALVLGAYDFRISPGAQAVGFALFIFSVGYQAGPRFVAVLKKQGLQYLALSVFVVAVGFATAWLAGVLLRLPLGGNAGLLGERGGSLHALRLTGEGGEQHDCDAGPHDALAIGSDLHDTAPAVLMSTLRRPLSTNAPAESCRP